MAIDNDVMRDVETQSGPLSGRLGREKWIEDPWLDVLRYTRSVILDLHDHTLFFLIGPDRKLALSIEGIDRVIDDVRPDLIELTGIGFNVG